MLVASFFPLWLAHESTAAVWSFHMYIVIFLLRASRSVCLSYVWLFWTEKLFGLKKLCKKVYTFATEKTIRANLWTDINIEDLG